MRLSRPLVVVPLLFLSLGYVNSALSATKNLYTYYSGLTSTLQRVVPPTNTTETIPGNNGSVTLNMTPTSQSSLTLGAGTIPVRLCIDRAGGGANQDGTVRVTLGYTGGSSGTIGISPDTIIPEAGGYQFVTFNFNLATDVTLNSNTAIQLTVENLTTPAARNIILASGDNTILSPCGSGVYSRVELNANTVINVDSVDFYNAAYPGGSLQSSYAPGSTVYIRSVISDPFGSGDITGADIVVTDPNSTPTSATMTELGPESTASTRTYEFAQPTPLIGTGTWTASVTGIEGTEGTVTHTASNTFSVGSQPDLSTSTKTVSDLNGVEADPGDTLRYTITVKESAGTAANGASVTDTIDSLLTGFSVVSFPAGATDSSTPGTGPLNITGINVSASGTATIVFDATIAGTASPGDTIDNTAVINNPVSGSNTNAVAPTVTVSPSQIPSTGTKNLYMYYSGLTSSLQRVVPPTNTTETIPGNNGSVTLNMTPTSQSSLTLGAGTIPVRLCIDRAGGGGVDGTVRVTLGYTGASSGTIGISPDTIIPEAGGYQFVTFNFNLATDVTLNPNTAIQLTVENLTTPASRNIILASGDNTILSPCGSGVYSRVELNANTVINVDSVDFYNAPYPAVSTQASYASGSTVYIQSVISDPFGSDDITGANIVITDPTPTELLPSTAMTQVADPSTDTRVFEFAYPIPLAGLGGTWTASVTGIEGTEGTTTDLGVNTFLAGPTGLSIIKLVSTISDPVNTINPKAIPGSIVEYQIVVTNTGVGPADANSVVIEEAIPATLQMYLGAPIPAPVEFIDGTTVSGLTYTFTNLADIPGPPTPDDDIDFSKDGCGGPFTLVPVVDGDGFDISPSPINCIRINPKNLFNGSVGSGDPSFTLEFRARVR